MIYATATSPRLGFQTAATTLEFGVVPKANSCLDHHKKSRVGYIILQHSKGSLALTLPSIADHGR